MMSQQHAQAGSQIKAQGGFTLIELMIVVAIIGILAAIAIPAYQDYTIRARASESASVSSSVRTAIGVYYSERDALPVALAQLRDYVTATSAAYATKYVSALSVSGGTVQVQMKTVDDDGNDLGLGDAGGTTVTWIPVTTAGGAALDWRVSGNMPSKYRPREK